MSIAIRANQSGAEQAATQKSAEKKGHQNIIKSVNAGGLVQKNNIQSQIEARRNNAKKQALKVVSDAWKWDNQSAKDIEDMQGLKQTKVSEMNDMRAKMKDIENTKKSLQDEYGVSDDSKEQKDLELLEKYQNNINGSSYDEFSDEEIARLKELQNAPLTEYQKKVLRLNSMKGQVSVEAERKQYEVNALTASISDATLEQLKSRDMEKASDAADEIMDSANKEILGMLIEEGKNNVDDKIDDEIIHAVEVADKKEEQDEQVKEAKEKRKNQEEIIEGQQSADELEQDVSMQKQNLSKMDEAQKNIQKILKEKNLVNEDLKGIEIDLNF